MSSQPRSAMFRRSAAANSSSPHGEDDAIRMEQENNALMRALLDDVKGLKAASGRIRTEVQSHNTLLNALLNTTESAKRGLSSTMKKLDTVTGGWTSNSHMWLLFVFAFVVCWFIVMLLKFR